MGVIAEGIMAYAQPLINLTDGSMEQMNKALAISQVCWNLAIVSEVEREQLISQMPPTLHMEGEEFDDFRRSVIDPMIRRHHEMFPLMHRLGSSAASPSAPSPQPPTRASARETYSGTEPYAPCPCKSGRKYKFCCRKTGR